MLFGGFFLLLIKLGAMYIYYMPKVVIDVITLPKILYTTSGLSTLMHGVALFSDVSSYDKSCFLKNVNIRNPILSNHDCLFTNIGVVCIPCVVCF